MDNSLLERTEEPPVVVYRKSGVSGDRHGSAPGVGTCRRSRIGARPDAGRFEPSPGHRHSRPMATPISRAHGPTTASPRWNAPRSLRGRSSIQKRNSRRFKRRTAIA